MNKVSLFYNYEQCYNYYVKCIDNIRQHKVMGEFIVAKPVFFIAIIDGIDNNIFTSNRFTINEWLESHYINLLSSYSSNLNLDQLTGIEKPFWHLESDGFWHLIYQGEHLTKSHTPSKKWLKEQVEYACLDDDLWVLLQNQEWRKKVRVFIISHKLK